MKRLRKRILPLIAVLVIGVCAGAFVGCSPKTFDARTAYAITAELNDNHTLKASMQVSYINSGERILNEVKFHLHPNAYRENARFSPIDADDLTSAYPNGMSYGGITVSNVTVAGKAQAVIIGGEDENILTVALTEPLYPSASVEIGINFTVTLANIRHRLGYFDSTVMLGNWYPIACVAGENGFYEYPYYDRGDPFFAEVADYEVSLTVPGDLVAAMSGGAEKSVNGAKSVYTASGKGMRDFAAVVAPFHTLSTKTGGIDVSYYYINDAQPEVSMMVATDALRTFGGMFGEYPFDSYAVVETPFVEGGMEYSALVYISNTLKRETFTETIVHETAHQWWYGVVGNDQVASAWLDEGLAEFSTTMFFERNADYNVDAKLRVANTLTAYILYYDSWLNRDKDTSLTRASYEYATAFEYAFLSYAKGALMFESVRMTVGEEKFIGGLKAYYEANAYGIATPDDLIGCMEQTSGRALKPLFDSWLNGNVQVFGNVAVGANLG